MKISLNWLKEYLDIDYRKLNLPELVNKLAILGFEAETVETICKDFSKVVVGKVISKEKHPDADKLSICKVKVADNDEPENILQIVCGAPNVAAGQTVPVALIGAVFGGFKIKKGKMRGVESFGMICAEDELELGSDHDGIMVLDDKYLPGTPLKNIFGFEDTVIDFEITPNRPDMLGYFGFAREVGCLLKHRPTKPIVTVVENNEDINNYITIENKEPLACPRYTARLIKGCKVTDSPDWLKEKLLSVGLRPINNIVDVTNFILMETGHPMHAFDYQEIKGKKIVIRRADNGEKFTTLDEIEYELNNENLLICNNEEAVALAGVMGGLTSKVNESTADILLEVAYFNLADIRHTVNRLKINTDSSKRFERGVDPNDAIYVINRAASIMAELSGGEIVNGIADFYPKFIEEKKVIARFSRTKKILGFSILQEQIINDLNNIDLKCERLSDDEIVVTIPTFRPDITKEIDIIEEIVRLYGYDKIPAKIKADIDLEIKDSAEEVLINKTRSLLLNLGLYETSSKSMIDGKYCKYFSNEPVKIAHPLNEEQNHLRNSLFISMLQVTKNNINRKNEKINIFEVSKRFYKAENNIKEENNALLLLCGKKNNQSWNVSEEKYDFYDIKGHMIQFLEDANLRNYDFKNQDIPKYFDKDEALSVYANKLYLGTFGLVNDEVLKGFDIQEEVYAFEFSLENFQNCLNRSKFKLEELSRYPKVVKDISFKLENGTDSSIVEIAIKKSAGRFLKKLEVVDLYVGDQLPDGYKSYSYRLTFQSLEKTLKEKEIDKMFNKIINGVTRSLNIEIR